MFGDVGGARAVPSRGEGGTKIGKKEGRKDEDTNKLTNEHRKRKKARKTYQTKKFQAEGNLICVLHDQLRGG